MQGVKQTIIDARVLIANGHWINHRCAVDADGEIMPARSRYAVAFSGTGAVLHLCAPREIEDAALALLNEAAATFIGERDSVVIDPNCALDEVNDTDDGFYGLPDPHACVLRVFDMAIAWAPE